MRHEPTRRSFLGGAAGLAVGGLAGGPILQLLRTDAAWAGQAAAPAHAASARLLDQLRTRLSFQISVDVGTIEQGISVATAALAGGATIVEMGTPLLKNSGVANVVPAFRKQFPNATLLADMKTMDGGAFEARAVFSGGANIFDLLALADVNTVKMVCGVRDEFRRDGVALARLVFTDIMIPQQGPAATAAGVARRMLDAGVDGIGIHLQADTRRADPSIITSGYLDDVSRAVFARVGASAPVQVVGGLTIPQAKGLAKAGLRAFVISGNLGLPDSVARYDLPPAQIQKYVSDFIAGVSAA
jgi:3-keto-L-gulonate-6-phosphate decarboxylase